jgi:hypothetical protein
MLIINFHTVGNEFEGMTALKFFLTEKRLNVGTKNNLIGLVNVSKAIEALEIIKVKEG